MQTTFTKKFNITVEVGDLVRLFRVLGYFEEAWIVNPEMKTDALLLLDEFKDLREVIMSPAETTYFDATLDVIVQYEKSSTEVSLNDITVPGEVLPTISEEVFEKADPPLDAPLYERGSIDEARALARDIIDEHY